MLHGLKIQDGSQILRCLVVGRNICDNLLLIQAVERWEEIAMAAEDAKEQFNIWSRIIQILEKVCSYNLQAVKLQPCLSRTSNIFRV